MRFHSCVFANTRLFLLHLFSWRFDRLFGLGSLLDTEHILNVLDRVLFQYGMNAALNLSCKTLWLQDISDAAKEKGDANKYIKDLRPKTSHFAKSQCHFWLAGTLKPAVTYVNLLGQIRLPGGRFESDHFA